MAEMQQREGQPWMRWVLWAAAVYNLVWGAWVVLFPNSFFDWVGMARPVHPSIWQCVGMIVGVYGIGYAIAATDPLRHWPIVLVGFLGKVLGPIGYVDGAFIRRELSPAFGWTIPTNDVIWWVPFAMILWAAFRAVQGSDRPLPGLSAEETADLLDQAPTDTGETVGDLSRRQPLLVMLVRHMGCTFCREALHDLGKQREALAQRGLLLVVVHQSTIERGRAMLDRHGLAGVPQVSDPERLLYRGLGLPRGTFGQLFGVSTWLSGLRAIRHGLGRLEGDGFQMPGAFVIKDARVVEAYAHRHAGDRVDVCGLADCAGGDDSERLSRPGPHSERVGFGVEGA